MFDEIEEVESEIRSAQSRLAQLKEKVHLKKWGCLWKFRRDIDIFRTLFWPSLACCLPFQTIMMLRGVCKDARLFLDGHVSHTPHVRSKIWMHVLRHCLHTEETRHQSGAIAPKAVICPVLLSRMIRVISGTAGLEEDYTKRLDELQVRDPEKDLKVFRVHTAVVSKICVSMIREISSEQVYSEALKRTIILPDASCLLGLRVRKGFRRYAGRGIWGSYRTL